MKTAFTNRMAHAMRTFRQSPEYRAAERASYARFLNQMHSRGSASGVLLPGRKPEAKKA